MKITRRAFLVATTAFTTINLFHPIASAGIDPESLQRDRWYAVWYQPMDAEARKIADFSGIEKYSLPDNTFLKLSDFDRWKIKTARPGFAPDDRTTHFFRDVAEYIPTENVGLKELLAAVKSCNPELDARMTETWLSGKGGSNVAAHIARTVGEAYGIDTEGRKHGIELWNELEQAVSGER